MDTKQAVIVFCSDEIEVDEVMKLLKGKGKAAVATSDKSKAVDDFDDLDELDGLSDDIEAEDLPTPTKPELHATLVAVRDAVGEEALKAIFKAHGVANFKALEKSTDEWPAVWAEAKNLLKEDDGDDLSDLDVDDDLDDLDEETATGPSLEEVKKAVQKLAAKKKETAQKILAKFGFNTVRGLPKADAEQLAGIMALVEKHSK